MAAKSHTQAGKDSAISAMFADVLNAVNKVSDYKVENRFTGAMPEVLSTGIAVLDELTGIGGLPMGQISQVYGPPSQFKSGFAMHMAGQAQRAYPNKLVMYMDTEGSYTHQRAIQHGVDPDRLFLIQGNIMEEKIVQALAALDRGHISFFVIDSWGAFIEEDAVKGTRSFGKKDADGNKVSRQPAVVAKLSTQFIQVLNDAFIKHKFGMLVVDQNRSKIGVTFGAKEQRTGGHHKAFAIVMEFSVRLIKFVRSGGDGSPPDGAVVGFNFVKNKYSPSAATNDNNHPTFWFGPEAQKMGDAQELLNKLINAGIIEISTSWYSWTVNGVVRNKWQGKMNTVKALLEDDELSAKMRGLLATKERLSGTRTTAVVPQEPVAEPEDTEPAEE